MGKTIIKGVKKDGMIDAEYKRTAVLITELIAKLPRLCEAEVRHSLEEIRLSSEQDERIRMDFAHALKRREKK
jgi:hypothetical protein